MTTPSSAIRRVLARELPQPVGRPLDLVEDRVRLAVTGDRRRVPLAVVLDADAANRLVHALPEVRHLIRYQPPGHVVGQLVNGAVAVRRRDRLPQRVDRNDEPARRSAADRLRDFGAGWFDNARPAAELEDFWLERAAEVIPRS